MLLLLLHYTTVVLILVPFHVCIMLVNICHHVFLRTYAQIGWLRTRILFNFTETLTVTHRFLSFESKNTRRFYPRRSARLG